MTGWREEVEQALHAFVGVAAMAGDPIARTEMEVEYLDAPHRPPSRLPIGKRAVYAFHGDGGWLKIGQVGPKSGPRYTSHHYNAGSAISTLAGSLVNDSRMLTVTGFDPDAAGIWIKAATHRV